MRLPRLVIARVPDYWASNVGSLKFSQIEGKLSVPGLRERHC